MSTRGPETGSRRHGSAEAAFEALFRTHGAALCDFAASYVRTPAVAEDLVHDVFCDIWDRWDELGPRGPERPYLYRAVRNKALNWIKHREVHQRWSDTQEAEPAAEDASRDVEYGELRQALADALDGLPGRQRDVYLMARQRDLSYSEIAEALEISPKSVENHMGRALKRLRKVLSGFFSVVL